MDIATAPAQIKGWMECLFWFAGFIGGLLYIREKLRGEKPHPPNERLGQSQEELDERVTKLESWRDDLTKKLEKDKQEILLSGSQRGQRIYVKIDEEVKAIREDMKDMNRDLTNKCEAIPSLVIATLVNAKKLND